MLLIKNERTSRKIAKQKKEFDMIISKIHSEIDNIKNEFEKQFN